MKTGKFRWMFACLTLLLAAVALAQEEPAAESASQDATTVPGVRQQHVQRMVQDLEQKFVELARSLEQSEPGQAARLVAALQQSKQSSIETRMSGVAKMLNQAQFAGASDEQKKLVGDLQRLIEILLEEESADDEIEQLERWKQEISKLIERETDHRRESEKVGDKDQTLADLAEQIAAVEDLIKKQQQVLERTAAGRRAGIQALGKVADQQRRVRAQTEAIAKQIGAPREEGAGEEGSENQPGEGEPAEGQPAVSGQPMEGEGKPGEGQPGEGQPGEGQPGEGQPGEGQPGEGQPGEGQPGEGQPGEGQPGEGQPGEGQPGEGQPGEGQPGEGQPGEGQPGEGQPGEGQPGEGQPGEGQPGEGQPGEGQPGEGQPGEGQPGEGQPGEGKPGEGKPGEGKPGEGKPGEGKPGEGKPGEGKPGEGQSGEGQSGEGQSGEGQSGEGQSGEGQSGEGQSGEGQSGEGQQEEKPGEPGQRSLEKAAKKQQQAEKGLNEGKGKAAEEAEQGALEDLNKALAELKREARRIASLPPEAMEKMAGEQDDTAKEASELGEEMAEASQGGSSGSSGGQSGGQSGESGESGESQPGQEQVQEAQEAMEQASGGLRKKEPKEAAEKQREAIKKLQDAQKEIEDRLAQLRKEIQIEKLAALEARFQQMLDRQEPVTKGTHELEELTIQKKLTRVDRLKLPKYADEERAIGELAQKALDIIVEDGTSVVFSHVVEQLRDDLISVGDLLGGQRTDSYTQAQQQEIEATLRELIDALQKAQKQLEESQSGSGQGGGEQEESLLPGSAELKLLKAAQLRVNRRTKSFEEVRPASADLEPVMKKEIQKIATRQEEIAQITDEMVEKN